MIGRVLISIGLVLMGTMAHAAGPRARTYNLNILTISEVVTNPAVPTSQVATLRSRLQHNGADTGSVSGDRPDNSTPPLAGNLWMPQAYGTPTLANLLASAKTYSQTIAASVTSTLQKAMKSSNSSSAIFQFDQEVQVQGQPTVPPPHLVWTLFTDSAGRVLYGDPIVIPGTPTYIYAIYTPKSVASGLPSGWAYPDAGTLKYQVLKTKDNSVVQNWVTLDVNGVYDDPVQTVNSGVSVDPDKGLKCLINATTSGCTTGYADLNTLMGQTGVIAAVVDYTRQVQPTTQVNSDGTVSPKASLSYDQRNWSWTTCTYQNIGSLGMELNAQTDRYLVLPSGQYSLMGTSSLKSQAPTQSFNISSGVSSSYVSALSAYVFDPVTTGNPLTQAGAMPGIVNLAGITETGNPSSTFKQQVYAGPGNGFCTATFRGRCTAMHSTQTISFNVSNVASVTQATVSVDHLDDGGVIAINGMTVFAGNPCSGRCRGGAYWLTRDNPGNWGWVFFEQSNGWGYIGAVDVTSYLVNGNNTFTVDWGGTFYGDITTTLTVSQRTACQ